MNGSTCLTGGALTLLLACGTEQHATQPDAGTTLLTHNSTWSEPVNLGPVVNSPFVDFTPEISKDGLSLYFGSDRPGGMSPAPDIWVSHRRSLEAPWEAPVNLGPVVNSPGADAAPNLSRDGHDLYFSSTRDGGLGQQDLWVSWRADVHDDFAWGEPVNLGAAVNSGAFDAGPSFLGHELYFTSNRETGDPLDVFRSLREGSGFGPAELVPELSSDGNDLRPTLRIDGKEIFLSSDRAGSVAGSQDIWSATRSGRANAWSTPENLDSPVNTEATEQQPALSDDATTLFFASDRPGGSGDLDIWVTTR
jgi:Tol biopolymer transport system component